MASIILFNLLSYYMISKHMFCRMIWSLSVFLKAKNLYSHLLFVFMISQYSSIKSKPWYNRNRNKWCKNICYSLAFNILALKVLQAIPPPRYFHPNWFCRDLRCFVAKSVLSQFTHFCVEKNYTKNCLCGEKMTNIKYGYPLPSLRN